MTLDEFLSNPKLRNAWVTWDHIDIYVRRSRHCVDGAMYDTFDLANMNSPEETRGKGSFWALVEHVKTRQMLPLYVESLLNERLAESLRKRGWIEVHHHSMGITMGNSSFFLPR